MLKDMTFLKLQLEDVQTARKLEGNVNPLLCGTGQGQTAPQKAKQEIALISFLKSQVLPFSSLTRQVPGPGILLFRKFP